MTHSELQAKKKCNRSPEMERTSTYEKIMLRLSIGCRVWSSGRCCGKKKTKKRDEGIHEISRKSSEGRQDTWRYQVGTAARNHRSTRVLDSSRKDGYLFCATDQIQTKNIFFCGVIDYLREPSSLRRTFIAGGTLTQIPGPSVNPTNTGCSRKRPHHPECAC